MKTAAIICEYNPFHNGHLAQIQAVRKALGADTAVVCAMSGNFVQRGAPAVFDKYTRAAAAVDCGADVVLELPPTVSLRSAEGYAAGAVEILERLGGVDVLCFGSESGDLAALDTVAARLLSPEFPAALKDQLQTGVSFARARANALGSLGGDAALLERPNDILAVEYCKALRRRNCSIAPMTLRRPGGYFDLAQDPKNPSASAVRAALLAGDKNWKDLVPEPAAARFAAAMPHTTAFGERAMLALLRALPEEGFAALPFGGEGLWRRFFSACRSETTLEGVLTATKTKRYARTRIQRMSFCACLGLTAAELEQPPEWVRLLGLSQRGRAVLRKKNPTFRLVSGGNGPAGRLSQLEQRADDFYLLFARALSGAICWAKDAKPIYRSGDTPQDTQFMNE